MSPEQASGEMVVDSRSDVYALGCVLYEMLAGEPAFRGPTAQATLARQLEGPPSLRTVRPAAPHGLERVVERACRVIPMDRYRSAADFGAAVRATGTDERVGRSAPARFGGVLLGGMMAVAVLWGGWAALQHGVSGSGAPDSGLSPQRVMIAALDNETGDPELDDLGSVAADWLAREVQRIEAVEVVDPRAILQASFSPGESGEGSQRDLAERLGAGTLVSGSYYLASDSIQFLTRIIDTGSGRLIQAVDPVAVPRQDPLLGLELLGGRVLAATAALRSPDFSPGAEVLTHPQSYEAYRAYISAMESFSRLDFQSAFVHARRAETLDSTFHPSGLLVATIQFNMGHLAAMDSTLRDLQANRARLTTVEGHVLDSWQALLRGERAAAFRASRAAHIAAPTSPEIALLGAGHALFAGYLLTAVEMLRIPEMDQGPLRDWPPRWRWLLTSLHLLGDHEAELQAAREARNRLPDQHASYEWEARALIGLGRLEEMERVREELLLLPPTPSWSKGDVARELARELEAHGYERETRALRREAIAWFEGRPDDDADQIEHREGHAWAHYDNGDWAAAREILVPLAEAEPENLRYIGMSGVIAAHEGKLAEARSIDQRLAAFETPYVRGSNTNWRASIAVALGERARAMELLRRAFGEGLSYNHWIHVDPAYKPLWGYPPFQALARPRD